MSARTKQITISITETTFGGYRNSNHTITLQLTPSGWYGYVEAGGNSLSVHVPAAVGEEQP